jgi:hypothetical protein
VHKKSHRNTRGRLDAHKPNLLVGCGFILRVMRSRPTSRLCVLNVDRKKHYTLHVQAITLQRHMMAGPADISPRCLG